jgi:hypothetical protein
VIDAWQQAGPARVLKALARAFDGLADAGLLRAASGELTASHFARLVAVDDPLRPGTRPGQRRVKAMIAEAVHAFLYGYGGSADAPRRSVDRLGPVLVEGSGRELPAAD